MVPRNRYQKHPRHIVAPEKPEVFDSRNEIEAKLTVLRAELATLTKGVAGRRSKRAAINREIRQLSRLIAVTPLKGSMPPPPDTSPMCAPGRDGDAWRDECWR